MIIAAEVLIKMVTSSEVPPKNYREHLLEEPTFHNTTPHQVCSFCGSLDTEKILVEGPSEVYHCNNCGARFKHDLNVRTGNFAISQPSHFTDRGIGSVQAVLGR